MAGADINTESSVFGFIASIIGIWALYAHGYLWGVATGLSSPVDVLAMILVVVAWIYGALAIIGFVLIALGLLALAAIGGGAAASKLTER